MLIQSTMRKASGFTLIELMMGIAVMMLALALAVPSYKAWIHNTRIRNAAESILNGLQLARTEAISRNTPVQFILGPRSNWTVDCLACAVAVPTIQTRLEGEGSSGDVTVTSPDGTTFTFNSFGRLTAPVPLGGLAAKINVDINTSTLSAAESRDLRITVDAGGNARMCDPNVLTAGDSRLCPP